MSSFTPIRNALISVYDKRGLPALANFLVNNNVTIYSTGGTYGLLQQHLTHSPNHLRKVSDLTQSPEILNGRVKTLHPIIYGGILARRHIPHDMQTLNSNYIPPIDLVVTNLYPFQETVANPNSTEDDVIENIDIGGPSMVRAAAKNFKAVTVLTNPAQYDNFTNAYTTETLTETLRKKFALEAFKHVTEYDMAIATYFDEEDKTIYRSYQHLTDLKYGLNPNQKNAKVYYPNTSQTSQPPFEVLNGTCGYINILDAVNANALVTELNTYFTDATPTAASYKHTSPAGVAFSRDLSEKECQMYNVTNADLTPTAKAYILARYCDPKSSFGDFVAISSTVDVTTARLIKREVSDGIIAPDYDPEALEILKTKKKGKFIILKSNTANTTTTTEELRTYQGVTLMQNSNNTPADDNFSASRIPTAEEFSLITPQAATAATTTTPINANTTKNNLFLANATLKYTQSNSVAFSRNGQCVVAAGQQNRVDCTRLAGTKLQSILLRFHPKSIQLYNALPSQTPRQAKTNALIQYLEQEFTPESHEAWRQLFSPSQAPPEPITDEEQKDYLSTIYGNNDICLASDAFFPFEDNIDVAHRFGVKHIVQTGGSIRDPQVVQRCNEYGISMLMTGNRFFLH